MLFFFLPSLCVPNLFSFDKINERRRREESNAKTASARVHQSRGLCYPNELLNHSLFHSGGSKVVSNSPDLCRRLRSCRETFFLIGPKVLKKGFGHHHHHLAITSPSVRSFVHSSVRPFARLVSRYRRTTRTNHNRDQGIT